VSLLADEAGENGESFGRCLTVVRLDGWSNPKGCDASDAEAPYALAWDSLAVK